jgi:hypothetical protein
VKRNGGPRNCIRPTLPEALIGLIGIILLVFPLSIWSQDKTSPVAVIYPDAPSPIKQAMEQIVSGIERTTKDLSVHYLPVNESIPKQTIQRQLTSLNPYPMITLGDSSLEFAKSLGYNEDRLLAAVLRKTSKDTVKHGLISLALDENVIKKYLRLFAPQIRTIHYGDDGRKAIWGSKTPGSDFPHFKTTRINNSQSAIVKYLWEKITTADPSQEAVWINTHLEPYVLYKLSEKAWERGVLLISSNISHLNNGVSLVFFINNQSMGERIGELVKVMRENKSPPPPEALTAVSQGINVKFARHAGINIPSDLSVHFEVIK